MSKRRKTFRRGRTRSGRLALLDTLLETGAVRLDNRVSSLVVDVGFGDAPITTKELSLALTKNFAQLKTVGVELDPRRVERAQDHTRNDLSFALGGFDVLALGLGPAMLVRCFNVLRGYGPEQQKSAQLLMLRGLSPGGLLVEGSTDANGALLAAHLWRRSSDHISYEGLVVATDFSRGFSPLMFRDVLPRDLRRQAKPGETVFDWLCRWDGLVKARRGDGKRELLTEPLTNQSLFASTARELSTNDVRTNVAWAQHGAVTFHPTQPSERSLVLCPADFVLET